VLQFDRGYKAGFDGIDLSHATSAIQSITLPTTALLFLRRMAGHQIELLWPFSLMGYS
jgi:hypothetical protein